MIRLKWQKAGREFFIFCFSFFSDLVHRNYERRAPGACALFSWGYTERTGA